MRFNIEINNRIKILTDATLQNNIKSEKKKQYN